MDDAEKVHDLINEVSEEGIDISGHGQPKKTSDQQGKFPPKTLQPEFDPAKEREAILADIKRYDMLANRAADW